MKAIMAGLLVCASVRGERLTPLIFKFVSRRCKRLYGVEKFLVLRTKNLFQRL